MKTSMTKSIAALILIAALFTISCSGNSEGSKVQEPRVSIHEATFMGNTKAVKDHIAFGTDLDVPDEYGSTPLNIAITFDKTEISKLLIEGGADLTVKLGDGSTVLHTAAFFGRTEIVESILAKGIDTQIRNNYGATAQESLLPPFEAVKVIYDQMARDLGPLGLKLDYQEIQAARPLISEMIANYDNAQK